MEARTDIFVKEYFINQDQVAPFPSSHIEAPFYLLVFPGPHGKLEGFFSAPHDLLRAYGIGKLIESFRFEGPLLCELST